MRIKSENKYIAKVLMWLFRVKPYKVEFVYTKEHYDDELSYLGFLNQCKNEFMDYSSSFLEELEEAIDAEANKTR